MAYRLIRSLLLVLVVMVALLALLPATATPDSHQQVVDLVNAARAREGLPPLTYESRLTQAAQNHSVDMAAYNYLSHTGRDGSSPWDRMHRVGYDFGAAGECIAGGQSSPEQAVSDLLNSPDHRRLLMGSFLDIGVGYGYSDAGFHHYWTLDLGTTRATPTPVTQTPRPPTPTATRVSPWPSATPSFGPSPTATPRGAAAGAFVIRLPVLVRGSPFRLIHQLEFPASPDPEGPYP